MEGDGGAVGFIPSAYLSNVIFFGCVLFEQAPTVKEFHCSFLKYFCFKKH